VCFEISKAHYLKECAVELFDNYASYLSYAERLAAKFYLLKAYLFYTDPLLKDLTDGLMPQALEELGIDGRKWAECTRAPEYKKFLSKL
jgi:hypothetical protein